MTIPAHKNVINPPGQIVESDLNSYIRRKQRAYALDSVAAEKKKLSFREWVEDSQIYYSTIETKEDLICVIERVWKAAQENK